MHYAHMTIDDVSEVLLSHSGAKIIKDKTRYNMLHHKLAYNISRINGSCATFSTGTAADMSNITEDY